MAVKLVKNNIPNLQTIYVNFRSRAAGAFFSCRAPKIIHASSFNLWLRNPYFISPNLIGTFIPSDTAFSPVALSYIRRIENSYIIHFQTHFLSYKFICPMNTGTLKVAGFPGIDRIISAYWRKGKIAHHFKKSKMTFISNFLNV